MNFDLSEEEQAFSAEVERFLDEHATVDVADVLRENMAQLVDTPPRRAFMKKLAAKGWLGMSWPKQYGGQEMSGIYDFILCEALARRGAPQMGKGIGVVGKTLIRHGSDQLKAEFLPQILRAEIEFAIGYSEPNAGSDAANMQLKAERVEGGWLLNGQKTWTTSAHFADWYWLGARTNPDAKKHDGISVFLLPMSTPGLEIQALPTIGEELTNQVFFTDVFVDEKYLVGEEGRGFRYISEALDLERFSMYQLSSVEQRFGELLDYVRNAKKDGTPLREDPRARKRIAQLTTDLGAAKSLQHAFVAAALTSDKPPTCEASQYKLYATELNQRLADAMMDICSPGSTMRVRSPDAPLRGRPELVYRFSVIDTIGAGSSEIQKNIIARRKLGLPKNF
ncbi:MAG: acyl-CoA dehydrogenase family protein [Deltaproteobacteria bacterium]|nr:acyl-CoA dehydrogenase family protein [Deltaproteobacteria bacterium]